MYYNWNKRGIERIISRRRVYTKIFLLLIKMNHVVAILQRGFYHLRYWCGAYRRNRTADLQVTNLLLYQLSYISMKVLYILSKKKSRKINYILIALVEI